MKLSKEFGLNLITTLQIKLFLKNNNKLKSFKKLNIKKIMSRTFRYSKGYGYVKYYLRAKRNKLFSEEISDYFYFPKIERTNLIVGIYLGTDNIDRINFFKEKGFKVNEYGYCIVNIFEDYILNENFISDLYKLNDIRREYEEEQHEVNEVKEESIQEKFNRKWREQHGL